MKETKTNAKGRTRSLPSPALPDDFPDELLGEFRDLPEVTIGNLGRVAGATVRGGGYFGISVTDDGGSAKLAVRCALVTFDRRVYKLTDLESLLAYCDRKLRGG